jgi:hypothetical protein
MYEADLLLKDKRTTSKLTQMSGGRNQGWTGSFDQRSLVSFKLPQAVLKITSYSKSKGGVVDRMMYIARDGDINLETDQGDELRDVGEIMDYADEWSDNFSPKYDSRKAMNMVLSLPRKTDKKCAMKVARQFMEQQFKDNHSYVMAGHDDTDQYHIHVIVKSQGHDGKQLNISKRDLQEWRINYATKARESGVQVDASPRYARGLGARRLTTAVHVMRERGQFLDIDFKYKTDAENTIEIGSFKQTENETIMLNRNKNERVEYAQAGVRAADEALNTNDDKMKAYNSRMAIQLSKFALELPVPKSRRELNIEALGHRVKHEIPDLTDVMTLLDQTMKKSAQATIKISNHQFKMKMAQKIGAFSKSLQVKKENAISQNETKAIKPNIDR